MMILSELDFLDAKCETCKYKREHKAGTIFQVCDLFTNDGIGLGAEVFKIEDDFVCANWEEREEEYD